MTYARVVVDVAPAHLDRPFDYRLPDGVDVEVGVRVRVTFAGRRRTGWVVGTAEEPDTDPDKVREIDAVEGTHTWFGDDELRLYRWVAERYAATLAAVLRHALPARVAAVEREALGWHPPQPVTPAERPPRPASAWRPYAASRLLRAAARAQPSVPGTAFWWRPLPGDDVTAMSLDLVARCLSAGRSALVLAPDPASPLPGEALTLAGAAGADLRAGGERERYRAFLRCRLGHARVGVGERGAALVPLRDLGLVLVADEANPAYKERRAPRHHAREVALARAWLAGATAVLIGDVPGAHLERLLGDGHVEEVVADRGMERERAPLVEVVDRSSGAPAVRRGRFAPLTARRIGEAVRAGGVAVVVAARGGQGAALACQGCGARRACPVCDGSLRPRRGGDGGEAPGLGGGPEPPTPPGLGGGPEPPTPPGVWECPACRWEGPPSRCPRCGDERTAPLAAGAGRLAQELARSHPAAEVVRMEGFDAPGPQRRPAIAVMTRGSAVERPAWLGEPGADVVVLPDADALLGRPSFDAAEDALRLWFAVARWTRRVVLQTREPGHPAVQALVRWDARGFWRGEAERRAELRYPPAAALVRLQAPVEVAADAAAQLRRALPAGDELLGPDPGGALLVKSGSLRGTLDALAPLRRAWSSGGTRVRVDVDPVVLD